ncbi:hypothetical protein ACFLWE_00645 [Chloroflexota bacterium]
MEKKKTGIDNGDNRKQADIVLARQFRMQELPGFLWKRLLLAEGQCGLITSGDHVIRVFPPPSKGVVRRGVGWNVPGFRGGRRAVSVTGAPFTAAPVLPPLETGGADPLLLQVETALDLFITDPVAFYSNLGTAHAVFLLSDLEALVAPALGKIIQERLTAYGEEALLRDEGEIGRSIALGMEEDLGKYLGPRGISLKKIKPLEFSPYVEPLGEISTLEEMKGQARTETLDSLLPALQKNTGCRAGRYHPGKRSLQEVARGGAANPGQLDIEGGETEGRGPGCTGRPA